MLYDLAFPSIKFYTSELQSAEYTVWPNQVTYSINVLGIVTYSQRLGFWMQYRTGYRRMPFDQILPVNRTRNGRRRKNNKPFKIRKIDFY